MRIGIIRRRYTPYGGAETFLKRFIDELLKRGHTIDAFSSKWEESEGVRVHKVDSSGISFLKPLVFATKTLKEVDKVRPDVLVSLERTWGQDIYRAGDGCHKEWLEKRMKTVSPVKRLMIFLNPLHMVLFTIEQKMFRHRRLKKVVANSKRVAEEIRAHYGLPEEKLCVIYNGVNFEPFDRKDRDQVRKEVRSSLGLDPGTTVLLFVGSGFERKGLRYLIRSLAPLKEKDPGIRLLVIGKGRTGRYRLEAARYGVGEMVTFLGPVEDPVKHYLASDIFVLPSIYEPFSNACLEALAAGLPVVTSRVNGASEILAEGTTGAVVEDPTDHGEIAEKVSVFLSKEARKRCAGEAVKTAKKYSIEKNVDEFLEVIEEVAARKAEG